MEIHVVELFQFYKDSSQVHGSAHWPTWSTLCTNVGYIKHMIDACTIVITTTLVCQSVNALIHPFKVFIRFLWKRHQLLLQSTCIILINT